MINIIEKNFFHQITKTDQITNNKEFEKNYKTIALNILYVSYNTEKIRHACKSKYDLKRENEIIPLMITGTKKWHYLAVKSLPALLKGITSNHKRGFYCLNCRYSFRNRKSLKKHKNVCENYDDSFEEMPKEDDKVLRYNNGEKSRKVPFII